MRERVVSKISLKTPLPNPRLIPTRLLGQTHVSLLFARENRQLIEILNADRFDYLFAESIEEQDFQEAKLRQDQFLQLNYDTSRVKDLKDPALRQISIACSIHPVTLAAMPYTRSTLARETLIGFEFNSSQVDARGMPDFGPNLLNNLRRLYLGNHNWNNESVIELVRKLHPETQALEIPSVGLT